MSEVCGDDCKVVDVYYTILIQVAPCAVGEVSDGRAISPGHYGHVLYVDDSVIVQVS